MLRASQDTSPAPHCRDIAPRAREDRAGARDHASNSPRALRFLPSTVRPLRGRPREAPARALHDPHPRDSPTGHRLPSFRLPAAAYVRPTPRLSCEAVPPSILTAGARGGASVLPFLQPAGCRREPRLLQAPVGRPLSPAFVQRQAVSLAPHCRDRSSTPLSQRAGARAHASDSRRASVHLRGALTSVLWAPPRGASPSRAIHAHLRHSRAGHCGTFLVAR